MAEKKVKVKILKFVGQHQPGEVIEVPESVAANLCKETLMNVGEGKMETHRKAMLLEEAEMMESMPVDVRKLSAMELAAMGKKNIVPTPKDPVFEARIKQLQAGKDVQLPGSLSPKAVDKEVAQPEWVPGAEDEAKEASQAEAEIGSDAEAQIEEAGEAIDQSSEESGKKNSKAKKASGKKGQ